MWDFQDYELAFQYFSIAETFIKPDTNSALHYTLILNYLQSYWLKKKEFTKSLIYANKIINFHKNQPYSIPPYTLWWKNYWQTLTHLNIAKIYIEQGELHEGSVHAQKSLQLSKIKWQDSETPTALIAEYDALTILVSIELKLNNTDSIMVLFNKALQIQQELELADQFDYFKSLPLYKELYNYYIKINNPEQALLYLRKVNAIQDSTQSINNHLEVMRIQQQLNGEKYSKNLSKIHKEKNTQSSTILGLILLLLLGVYFGIKYYQWNEKQKTRKQHRINIIKKELVSISKEMDDTTKKSNEIQQKYNKLHKDKDDLATLEMLKTSTLLTVEDWTNFKLKFDTLHPDFTKNIRLKHPKITNAELRLLTLEKLDLDTEEIANILAVNKNTIHQTRRRFRKKVEASKKDQDSTDS